MSYTREAALLDLLLSPVTSTTTEVSLSMVELPPQQAITAVPYPKLAH